MCSDGVRPWWQILVSQVVSLTNLMETAADSRKDSNFVEMNASCTVVRIHSLLTEWGGKGWGCVVGYIWISQLCVSPVI